MAGDWLDTDVAFEQLKAEPDWLSIEDTPAVSAALAGIEVPRADAPYEQLRFEVMKGSDRTWACNGRYVACRPSAFHEASRSRHQRFLRAGHYKHIGTFDDVQIFELMPESPFYRTEGNVRAGSWYELLRGAAQAAAARDWGAYVDLLEEIASRIKSVPTGTTGAVEKDLARDKFNDTLEYLEQLIFMRWHSRTDMHKVEDWGLAMQSMKAEIDAGVHNIRVRRGHVPSGKIVTRQGPLVIR
jgi:hypothetical protein